MTKEEMKNRISLALKDPVLQQGFEIICKENAELKDYNNYLKRQRQGGIQKQYNKVSIIKQQKKQLIKAKDLLRKFMSIYEVKIFGNEYKANLIFAYKWYKRKLVEDSERNPMHIAWRTRGRFIGVEK